jgi:hypothetical protein
MGAFVWYNLQRLSLDTTMRVSTWFRMVSIASLAWSKRRHHDADCQTVVFILGNVSNNGGRTRSGATALATCDKDQVGTVHALLDFRRRFARGIATRTQSARGRLANLQLIQRESKDCARAFASVLTNTRPMPPTMSLLFALHALYVSDCV